MEPIKTYVINLPKDRERRENILKETGKRPSLAIELVKAVYGKELAEEEKKRLFNEEKYVRYYGRSVLPGEIGCTLSHQECYKRLLNSDRKVALILEDDALFMEGSFTEGFSNWAVEFMNKEEPFVLLLHADFESMGKKSFFYGTYSLYPVYKALFTTAYLINKPAARMLLQKEQPYWVADDWSLFRQWGVRIFSLYPSAVVQQWDKYSSSILEDKRLIVKKRIFPRSWLECRLAYNKLVYIFFKKIGLIRHLRG